MEEGSPRNLRDLKEDPKNSSDAEKEKDVLESPDKSIRVASEEASAMNDLGDTIPDGLPSMQDRSAHDGTGGVPSTDDAEGDEIVRQLREASLRGNESAVLELLPRFAASPSAAAHESGWTSLMVACAQGHRRIVEMMVQSLSQYARQLVDYEQKPVQAILTELLDVRDEMGYAAIHRAVQSGHADCAYALLSAGASVTIFSHSHETPLHLACEVDRAEDMVAILLRFHPDFQIDARGRSPLHYAAMQGKTTVLRLLYEYARSYFADAARALPESPSDDRVAWALQSLVNQRDLRGHTCLMAAVARSDRACVQLLQDQMSASPDIAANDGRTALHMAAAAGSVAICTDLVAAGAPLNAEDNSGRTAVMAATARGHTEVVRLLARQLHADLSLKDSSGQTALDIARKSNRVRIIPILSDSGG